MKIVFKKSVTFCIILLFISVSLSSAYSNVEFKNEIVNSFEPVPKLECRGNIIWKDVKPNTMVEGTFEVRNNGEEGSILNWRIYSLPSFGEWLPEPSNGSLAPNNWITVTLYCRVTVQGEYIEDIIICNEDNTSECCNISIILETPRTRVEDCECNEVDDKHLRFLERQLNRIEVCNKLLLVLTCYNPELKEINIEISQRVTKLTNIFKNWDFMIICWTLLDITMFFGWTGLGIMFYADTFFSIFPTIKKMIYNIVDNTLFKMMNATIDIARIFNCDWVNSSIKIDTIPTYQGFSVFKKFP